MRKWSRSMKQTHSKTISLVPTMGYLHNSHISLIHQARQHSHLVIVSIYVNPGQFSTSEDISTYPSDFTGDLTKLIGVGVDPYDLYDYGVVEEGETDNVVGEVVSCVDGRGGHETWVRVEKLEKGLCGKSRPVFFRGVATVVCKLFNVVEPDFAVFGKKDYHLSAMTSYLSYGELSFCVK